MVILDQLAVQLLLLMPQAAQAGGGNGGAINVLVERFNEGGPWMWPVLVCLIIGLAISFERIISLNLADIDTDAFVSRVKEALEEDGIAAAEDVCAKKRGPVASVFQAGLLRADEGVDAVEEAVVSYGSIEMSFLERGLVWLSLFISVAPMLGFLGTVIGMIEAFDSIEQAGDISPRLVALVGLSVLGMATAGFRSIWYGKVEPMTVGLIGLPGVVFLVLRAVLGSWAQAAMYTLVVLFAVLLLGMVATGLRQFYRGAFS